MLSISNLVFAMDLFQLPLSESTGRLEGTIGYVALQQHCWNDPYLWYVALEWILIFFSLSPSLLFFYLERLMLLYWFPINSFILISI